jgi:soluble lytic murein transglycosylase-like protein
MRLLKIALAFVISSSLVAYDSDSLASSGVKSNGTSSHLGNKSHGRSKGKKQTAKTDSGDVWARIRQGTRIPRPSLAPSGFDLIPASTNKNLSGSSSSRIKTTDIISSVDEELARLTTVITPKKRFDAKSQLPEKLRERQLTPLEKGSNENNANLSNKERYTPLGKLRFAKRETSMSESLSNKLHIIPKEKAPLINGDSAFKSPSIQRIRTRLGFHPELSKNGGAILSEPATENFATNKKLGSHDKTSIHKHLAIRNCADLKKEAVTSLEQQGGDGAKSYTQLAEECRISQNAKVERVNKRIAGYSSGFLYQVSERARPYLYHVVDALSKYGLPLDLALLPIVESAYQPTALSPKSAAGIWQFIPSTASEYGLEQNEYYDARLDITASTHAAIRFLSGLNSHFKGDWLLSLAAYNCGQGTVDAAISRNQAEGLDTDFWSLDLPAETEDYVPRLLALATIFQNPGRYGLSLRPIKNEPYFIKVNIDHEADIKQLINKDLKSIAKLANFDPDQFGLLNSAYVKATISQSKPLTFLMPISNANLLHQGLAFMAQSYKDERNANSYRSSKPIPAPAEFTLSAAQAPLLSINLDEDPKWLAAIKKQPITFHIKNEPDGDLAEKTKTRADYWAVHYLDKGETLKAVAEFHGISEGKLRELNKFKSKQSASLGQRLLVPLKQIIVGMTDKKGNPSILYKHTSRNYDTLNLRL